VAEQQTQEMSHRCLPDEASHFRGQPGFGECLTQRQQSWFCDWTGEMVYAMAHAEDADVDGTGTETPQEKEEYRSANYNPAIRAAALYRVALRLRHGICDDHGLDACCHAATPPSRGEGFP
jgi:hypothetical protein